MAIIHQLDDVLANKIAAGEVVERPINAVKELVENSIDAKADQIDIIVREAGLDFIQVIDNGQGMDKEDALLCFMRHATSKIKDDEDLFNIVTLGFRGEALPSIAAVSSLELETSTGAVATYVHYEYGKYQADHSTNRNQGTTVTVRKLFQNVPARLKYIRSINSEYAHIQKYVEQMALSYPDIAFSLTHNGREMLRTSGNGDLLEVIGNIYGLHVTKNMIPASFADNEFKITGYLGKIEVNRASKNSIITLVNHRVVRNRISSDAINLAYRKYLADNRYPIAIINIEIDPYLVDVNVHPSKLEVKFSKEDQLAELIKTGVEQTLSQIDLTYNLRANVAPKISMPSTNEQQEFDIQKAYVHDSVSEPELSYETKEIASPEPDSAVLETEELKPIKQKILVKGQVHGTYIIAEDKNGMYLIDQHAAQERINYEYFLAKYSRLDLTMRDLLVPITLDYPISDLLLIEERKNVLVKLGINVEQFGDGIVIKQLPLWLKNVDEKIFVEEMIDALLKAKQVDVLAMQEHAIATLSCKASLKGNTYQTNFELQTIVDNLMRCDNPYVCPHGRPTIIHYSTYEIEKMFKRVV